MGLALQIIGVICTVASLVFGILAIAGKSPAIICLILLVIGVLLIQIGRKKYRS